MAIKQLTEAEAQYSRRLAVVQALTYAQNHPKLREHFLSRAALWMVNAHHKVPIYEFCPEK